MSNYTIKYGDTLSGIARANNTDVSTLMNLNPYITNANKIYAGKNLVLPDPQPTPAPQPAPTPQPAPQPTPTPAPVQPTTPAEPTQQLAEEYAKQQTANTGNDTQALLAQYEKIAEQQKQALQNQQQLTNNQINAQRDDVMQAYHANARQAYINSMLGKKEVEQQLSQAGLNTSGLVGSAYANVENAYGNNLASLQNNRDNSINQINRQLNDEQLQYAIEENKLLADIENTKLDLQKYGNELAYKKYQDALNNYMNFANYDYRKAIDERDFNYNKSIDDRNFNYAKLIDDRDYEYQKQRDAILDSQWQKEYELALKKASSSGSSSRSSGSGSKTGNYSLNDSNYEVTKLRDNVIAIKKPDGYATLTITPDLPREKVLKWGADNGVDLSNMI